MARTRTVASRDDVGAFALGEAGHKPGDLHRQLDAHVLAFVIGQQPVGDSGRCRIGGNRLAGGRRAMNGEIMQHIGAGVGAARQFRGAARLAGADVQDIERVARIKARTAGRR
jgi:hypothetical protein